MKMIIDLTTYKTRRRELTDWISELIPKDSPPSIAAAVGNEAEALLLDMENEINEAAEKAFDIFCKENDLCVTCVTGGYYCGSDHK